VRVLLIHNRYRSGFPGGEDVVVDQEARLLRSQGVTVESYFRSNDEMVEKNPVDVARVLFGIRDSARTRRDLSRVIKDFRPDVAHIHNTFPLISPAAYEVCSMTGVPIVQTLHNYRLSCVAATHFRLRDICQECSPSSFDAAVWHRCYRGSLPGSWAVANMLRLSWSKGVFGFVDRFLVLTAFAARWLVDHVGVDSRRVTVKPNFVDIVEKTSVPLGERGNFWVFVGRVSQEKGVLELLEAWRNLPDTPLVIIGDGPLLAECRRLAGKHNLPVTFTGYLPREQALRHVANARGLVFPSQWFEGMPMVLLEAWALGTPIVAARVGAAASLVDDGVTGLLHDPKDSLALAELVSLLSSDPSLAQRISDAGRRHVELQFSAEANAAQLLTIYRELAASGSQS
jgi:glycosyltransferase involved in cell wall biosynthesis